MDQKSRWTRLFLLVLMTGVWALGRVPAAGWAAAPSGPAVPPSLDPGLRPASGWWAEVQESIRRQEYEITWRERSLAGPGVYQAPNRAHNLRTLFTPDGIHVTPRSGEAAGDWQWGLSLTGYGDGAGIQPVRAAGLIVEGNRIEYRRLDPTGQRLVEWYVNDARGLEQGFTLNRPPERASPDPQSEIILELALTGSLAPTLAPDGTALYWRTPEGARVLCYDKLYAYDAGGRFLPASLSLHSPDHAQTTLRITVDATSARYPITVDPLAGAANWTAEGNLAGVQFGAAVSTAGDVNNDGYDDVIVGMPGYDGGWTDQGRVFVYLGTSAGLRTAASWAAVGGGSGAAFGTAVGAAGDVNHDGYDDVIIGEPLYASGEGDEGRVSVYHGSATGLGDSPQWRRESNIVGARFGGSVGSAGDVNGDGYDDVVIGASYYSSGRGQAYVYRGSASGLRSTHSWRTEGSQAGVYYGTSVGTAGDVNGDGYDDVIVGAHYDSNGQSREGRAYVYHGSSTGLSSTSNWRAESNQANAYFGRSAATAGDVNGDGYDDVIVGAMRYDGGQTNEGRAYVYHGSASGLGTSSSWTAEANQDSADFGFSVASAGDVNGDGYDEVIVGAREYDGGQANEGRVYLYYGRSIGLNSAAGWTAESNQAEASFGRSVSTAGDVNHDGLSDVIAGASLYDNGQQDEGRAYVYHGVGDNRYAPVAGFDASPRSGAPPLTVQFTDRSAGKVTGWSWAFGDGGASASQNPSHTYNNAGTYAVSLTVTGPGGSDGETKNGYITVSAQTPVAKFSADPTSGTVPLVVQFADQSTGQISDWLWNFGDGNTSLASNPSHTYNSAGTYAVSLTVTGPGGSDTETKNSYIRVDSPQPVAGFSASPRSGTAPLGVQFTDQSTGQISTWFWTFGDGSSSSARHPAHTYSQIGGYTVSLTVSGPGGSDTETKNGYIQVLEVGGVYQVYLPGTFTRWSGLYAHPCDSVNRYCEDNDTHAAAYGPVGPGWPYAAYPDDADDYYFFSLGSAGSVSVTLRNYRATGDLLLYRRTATGDKELAAQWGKGGSTMEIQQHLQAGTYYVRVYSEKNHTGQDRYTLLVRY